MDDTLGWGRFAVGGIEVYRVPGSHGDLIRDSHAPVLARMVGKCLEEAVRTTKPVPKPRSPRESAQESVMR